MRDNVFKLGTYRTEREAQLAVKSGERLARQLPGTYSFDVTRGGRANHWIACVSGSRADVILFRNKWS